MKDKVTTFPVSEYQRIKNRKGQFAVPCMVSVMASFRSYLHNAVRCRTHRTECYNHDR